MKKLTANDKLKIAIDFIKSIEQYSPNYTYICDKCGDDVPYLEEAEVNKLKDNAWHVLADLTD